MTPEIPITGCVKRKRPDLLKIGNTRLRQTWRSPLAKAGEDDVPDESDYDWLLAIADKASPKVRSAFIEALRKLAGTVEIAALAEAMKSGDVNRVMNILGIDAAAETIREAMAPMTTPLEDVFVDTARETIPRTLGASVGMRFDLTNPNTITFLRNYNFGLIRQISADTREGIRQVVLNAFQMGGHPYEQARIIRASIGLTDSQAATVENFRRLLETRDRDALTRALRDRRFDPTIDGALGETPTRELSPEQIDRMVDRYRERMIALRAQTIARTETLRASNAGQQMAWQQAADKGLINSREMRRFWLVTPDDRLCEYCAAVPELNPDGQPLGGYFETDLGPAAYPPLHPACRCVLYLDMVSVDADSESA